MVFMGKVLVQVQVETDPNNHDHRHSKPPEAASWRVVCGWFAHGLIPVGPRSSTEARSLRRRTEGYARRMEDVSRATGRRPSVVQAARLLFPQASRLHNGTAA